ncbi:DUF5683 domain-containing protein [Actinomadura fibrosa]
MDPQLVVEEPAYKAYDPLSPARAAFYSAVLPGLGQAYNGKYWKIPVVYAALGGGVYFYFRNDDEYDRYREAYKSRLAGRTDDEFSDANGNPIVSTNGLIEGQRFYQRNKEISILVTLGLYALNIIDANVDAHLQQFNVSEDLSLKPAFDFDRYSGKPGYGLSLNFNF